jgi:hypothetical protein
VISATSTHGFNQKIKQSEEDNKALDKFFSQWYDILRMELPVDKIGIDRLWTDKERRVRYSVEYKADRRTAETGNAFVETVSVDKTNAPGWVYTCAAQFLVYYVPQWNKAWVMSTIAIKNKVDDWKKKYKTYPAANENGYQTFGIAVPFKEFISIGCWQSYELTS